jgi:hypothetical protein
VVGMLMASFNSSIPSVPLGDFTGVFVPFLDLLLIRFFLG